MYRQTYLGDNVGSLPNLCNKVNTGIPKKYCRIGSHIHNKASVTRKHVIIFLLVKGPGFSF